VEKLERVLVAEEDAREALADARVESARLRAAAVEEARRLEADAADSCEAAIASELAASQADAEAEAARITREAAESRAATLSGARNRLDDAVRSVAASLEV